MTVALRRERVELAQYVRPLLPILVGIGTAALVLRTGEIGRLDFYRAAATIIPTLLLTLSAQGGFFRLSSTAESPLVRAARSITLETFVGSPFLERVGSMLRFGFKAAGVVGPT